MRTLLPAAALAALLALSGCFIEPVTVKTYEAAVDEYGEPDNCTRKPTGSKYCSWTMQKFEESASYKLILVFDDQGKLVRKYTQAEVD